MASWSGLFDGVHGDGHSLLVDRAPGTERLQDFMQRRGFFGYAKGFGGTVPVTRRRVDSESVDDTPGPAKNFMKIPGTATDGVNPPDRDIEVLNALGDARPYSDDATRAQEDAADLSYVADTKLKFTYPGDASGQTGPGF